MKTLFSIILFCVLSTSLFSAECRKHTTPYVGQDERGEPFFLKNLYTGYVITFRYTNPTPTEAPEVLIGMPEPVNLSGFSRRHFVCCIVNGIDSRVLEPKKYVIFNQKNESGMDVFYNFNGVVMVLRFAVSDSSPLLKMELRRGPGVPAEAVKTVQVNFNVLPCASGKKRNSYSREIVTPVQTYRGKAGVPRQRQKLSAKDSLLILQDAKYQGDKGTEYGGPVVLVPSWQNVLSGMAIYGTHQNMDLIFHLDPKASAWIFGILDLEKKRNNKEFHEYLKNDLHLIQ